MFLRLCLSELCPCSLPIYKKSQIHFKKPFEVNSHRKKVITKIRMGKVENFTLNLYI